MGGGGGGGGGVGGGGGGGVNGKIRNGTLFDPPLQTEGKLLLPLPS
jgi:hypothetical protein